MDSFGRGNPPLYLFMHILYINHASMKETKTHVALLLASLLLQPFIDLSAFRTATINPFCEVRTRSVATIGPSIWNDLPISLHATTFLDSFYIYLSLQTLSFSPSPRPERRSLQQVANYNTNYNTISSIIYVIYIYVYI